MTKNQVTLSLPYAVIRDFISNYPPRDAITIKSIDEFGEVNYFTLRAYLDWHFGSYFASTHDFDWDDENEIVYINVLV